MRSASFVWRKKIIDEPGDYQTRGGEVVNVGHIASGFAYGHYYNEERTKESWDICGLLCAGAPSDNDIIAKVRFESVSDILRMYGNWHAVQKRQRSAYLRGVNVSPVCGDAAAAAMSRAASEYLLRTESHQVKKELSIYLDSLKSDPTIDVCSVPEPPPTGQ